MRDTHKFKKQLKFFKDADIKLNPKRPFWERKRHLQKLKNNKALMKDLLVKASDEMQR